MSEVLDDCRSSYQHALSEFLADGGEEALMRAYELGRQALTEGIGILDMAAVHHDTLASVLAPHLAEDAASRIRAAEAFFVESLSAFEMSQRSVGEANSILRHLNHLLEEEVKRVAHALHDEAGGILASARVQLDLAVRGLPAEALARLAEVRKLLDETGERLRHLSHELRPTILDDLGLGPALEFLAQGIRQRTGVRVTVRGDIRDRLSSAAELAVYRAAQEALHNAVRHADGLSSVTVRLHRQRGTLRCVIVDDGAGFDVDALLGGKPGLGLLGMRERVRAVGGSFNIRSAPRQGTTVEILVPLED